MNAACRVAAGVEPLAQFGDELGRGAVELRGELDEPAEVGLADLLALAELLGRLLEPARLERLARTASAARPLERSSRRSSRRAASRSSSDAPWNGMPRVVQHLLEVGQPRVRAARIAASSSGQSSARIAATSQRPPPPASANGRTTGSGPSGRVARSVFSAPPRRGTSRFASSSTCGEER